MSKQNKKPRRSFGSYFSHNLLLKVLSLVFAVMLWSFVISQTNPVRTKTLVDVPVTVVGLDELNNAGFTLRDSGVADELFVTVRVSVSHSDYRFVDKNTIIATVDLSQAARKEGAATLPVVVSLANVGNVSLSSVSPSSLNLAIDTLKTKDVPLRLETSGVLPDGLISLSPSYPANVTITGAGYYVERIAEAVLDVDLSTLDDGASVTSLCRFTDEKNNAIKFNGVRVSADMDVMTVKEVTVDTQAAVTGEPASGYQLVQATAGKVKICGHKDVIEKVSSVTPDAIDVTGKDASFTEPLTFTLPEGLYLVPLQGDVNAEVEIIESPASVTLTRPLVISGLGKHTAALTGEGKTVMIKGDGTAGLNVRFTLTGTRALVDTINADDVIVRLSLEGRTAGTYILKPDVIVPSAVSSRVTAQLDSPKEITVSIE